MTRRRKIIALIGVWIVAFVVLPAIHNAYQHHHRPLFQNLYATHSMAFLPRYQPSPPQSDRLGNAVARDETLNMLACIFTDTPGEKNWFYLWGNRDRATLTMDYDQLGDRQERTRVIDHIDRTKNRLFVFDLRNNTRFEATLDPGDAKQIYHAIRNAEDSYENFESFLLPILKRYGYPKTAVPISSPVP